VTEKKYPSLQEQERLWLEAHPDAKPGDMIPIVLWPEYQVEIPVL
jgi:hypothetical protein